MHSLLRFCLDDFRAASPVKHQKRRAIKTITHGQTTEREGKKKKGQVKTPAVKRRDLSAHSYLGLGTGKRG